MTSAPDRCPKRTELEAAFLEANVKFTERLNRQMIAVAQGDLDFGKHDQWIDEARLERIEARDALLAHAEEHGCSFGSGPRKAVSKA
jgi:hypothetical protein